MPIFAIVIPQCVSAKTGANLELTISLKLDAAHAATQRAHPHFLCAPGSNGARKLSQFGYSTWRPLSMAFTNRSQSPLGPNMPQKGHTYIQLLGTITPPQCIFCFRTEYKAPNRFNNSHPSLSTLFATQLPFSVSEGLVVRLFGHSLSIMKVAVLLLLVLTLLALSAPTDARCLKVCAKRKPRRCGRNCVAKRSCKVRKRRGTKRVCKRVRRGGRKRRVCKTVKRYRTFRYWECISKKRNRRNRRNRRDRGDDSTPRNPRNPGAPIPNFSTFPVPSSVPNVPVPQPPAVSPIMSPMPSGVSPPPLPSSGIPSLPPFLASPLPSLALPTIGVCAGLCLPVDRATALGGCPAGTCRLDPCLNTLFGQNGFSCNSANSSPQPVPSNAGGPIDPCGGLCLPLTQSEVTAGCLSPCTVTSCTVSGTGGFQCMS